MRVVAGTYRGRRLQAPRGRATRPTADRVREALFSLLGPVEGLAALDLFAGSGALGIEALSRGAAASTFVDSSAAAVEAVRANLARLPGPDSEDHLPAEVVRADWRRFLRGAAAKGRTWDLVFCDPPYRLAHRLAGDLEAALRPVLAPRARIVCESSARQPLRLDLPSVTERRYGDSLIVVFASGE
jgi:16S rRNA (guanine966-N2)-methyltransferase